ncbi:hypothetical protein D9M71_810200 [compost metagenome]
MDGDGFPLSQQWLKTWMVLHPSGLECFTRRLVVIHWQVKPLDAEHLAFFRQQVDLVLKQLFGRHQRQQGRGPRFLEGL